jgi:NAD(P)-dependent dehydrogenase (short-subunit alcohol dehydrogenase family)
MQAVLPHMLERGYGKIVNIASTAGKWASKNQSAYNVAKHGVVGMTRCVALETAAAGITVNAICPGLVETDLVRQFAEQHAELNDTTPDVIRAELMRRVAMGRFLDVSECAHLAVYLASSESNGMTGQSILLDGGMLFV